MEYLGKFVGVGIYLAVGLNPLKVNRDVFLAELQFENAINMLAGIQKINLQNIQAYLRCSGPG